MLRWAESTWKVRTAFLRVTCGLGFRLGFRGLEFRDLGVSGLRGLGWGFRV